jgi:preprotein translocase subunit SecF
MRDVGEALKTLQRIILFFAAVILFFISLSVFGVEVGDSLSSVYTIGIGASFIFKSSASRAFDAIMFLFVTQ